MISNKMKKKAEEIAQDLSWIDAKTERELAMFIAGREHRTSSPNTKVAFAIVFTFLAMILFLILMY